MSSKIQPLCGRMMVALMTVLLSAGGCSSDPKAPAGPITCEPGETLLEDGRCQPAGLPLDMQCQPGELALENGGCQPAGLPLDMVCSPGEYEREGGGCEPAGIPPEMCAPGFMPDGDRGCEPILPADSCPDGLMAIPGETVCQEVMPCGVGDYGDIPVDATTQYVNAAYAANDGNGTKAKPWKTIQAGINAAATGAIVAVAAGTYSEDVVISGKPVKLWGRCPGMVELKGVGDLGQALQVYGAKASNTEVHGVAVTGPQLGALVVGAASVVLNRIRIHDMGSGGIEVIEGLLPADLTLSDSLIERAMTGALFVSSSSASVVRTAIRESKRDPAVGVAGGIVASSGGSTRSTLHVSATVFEKNPDSDIQVTASDVLVEDSVLGRGLPIDNGQEGFGLYVIDDSTGMRSSLTLRTSIVSGHGLEGVGVAGSNAVLEGVVLRDNGNHGFRSLHGGFQRQRSNVDVCASLFERNGQANAAVIGGEAHIRATVLRAGRPDKEGNGFGVLAWNDHKTMATVEIEGSLVEQNVNAGIMVKGADVTIDATAIQSTKALANGDFGDGIGVVDDSDFGLVGNVVLRRSLIEQNEQMGIFMAGGTAQIEQSVIRNHKSGPGIELQYGYESQLRSSLVSRASLIEGNALGGVIVFGSDARIESSIVRGSGVGIGAQADNDNFDRAKLSVSASLVANNDIVGISVINSDATIDSTFIRETKPDEFGSFGDGISVVSLALFASGGALPAFTTITASRIENNTRAGVSNFGSIVQLVSTEILCHPFDIDGEDHAGTMWNFDGSTNNKCGCPEATSVCGAKSAGLEATPPLL